MLQETDRALTPFGGIVVFLEFLNRIGLVQKVIECMPFTHRSPNSIPPAQTYIAFLISVTVGARRFAQTSWLRGDRALHGLLGIDRFMSQMRSLTNLAGNGVATIVVAKWENEFDPVQADAVLTPLKEHAV